MANNIIKSFTINGLFGTTNLTIPFDDIVKILIGENGLGKTQILNMLYFVLTKQWEKLKDLHFDTIILEISGEKVILRKNNVKDFDKYKHEENPDNVGKKDKFGEIANSWGNISKYSKGYSRYDKKTLKETEIKIDSILQNYQFLYLPTYRRIEIDITDLIKVNKEDLDLWDTLGYFNFLKEDIEEANNIQFGMEDIQKLFDMLSHNIEKLSKEGLSKISGEILSQLIKGKPEIDYDFLEKIKPSDIEILLARVGNGISESDKDGIRELVSNGKKDITNNVYFSFFLQKLIEIYDQQRELDNRIKRFRDVCNKYLVNKKVIYDESQIEIYIKADGADKPLHLSKLSSGEKQIISIFSKFYLSEPDERYIVLFDEPELSLSIFWQRNLLPDIYDSGKCELLFAVTHSPFIFENKLDKYTTSLAEYMTPLKPELVQ